jgi:hypothetical protein
MYRVRSLSLVGIAVICASTGAPVFAQYAAAVPANRPTVDDRFLIKEEPAKAAGVIAVRNNAKDQQDVLVVGRIGGKKNPWIRGVAAFPIVDQSLQSCDQKGHNCPYPWDYCCSANLSKSMVLVIFADEKGEPIKKDARELLGVKELDTVVVQGKARRDKVGNVVIMASKLHIHTDNEVARR